MRDEFEFATRLFAHWSPNAVMNNLETASNILSTPERPPIWKPHVAAATVVERDGRYLCVEERSEGRY